LIYLLLLLNSFKFIGLDYAPPDFYIDEVAGAVQAICLQESGRDFYGDLLPLFAPGVNDAFYTPTYLYGQALWITLFGKSIFAFRAFIAFVSCVTILFLYLWIKNIASKNIALYAVLAASVMPWVFHFSRIAWDPPVGVCFLIMGLWSAYRPNRPLVTAILLSLAAYSYSPLRIAIPLIWIFLPGLGVKSKAWVILWGVLLAIPLLIQMQVPEFTARSELRSLWSPYSSNQFRSLEGVELLLVGIKQFFTHLSPQFLFISGDQNIRHSIGVFGELSYLDLATYIATLISLIYLMAKRQSLIAISSASQLLVSIALLGIVANTLPAALTNEGAPHALRSLGAWPFYALLTGLCLDFLSRQFNAKYVTTLAVIVGVVFFSIYQFYFYSEYKVIAKEHFASDRSKINEAFPLITTKGLACKDVPKESKPKLPNELVKIKLDRPIQFSKAGYGALYLAGNWHEQETWGIWSRSEDSKLQFLNVPPAARSIRITMKALVLPSHPEQVLQVRVNQGPVQTFSLKDPVQNTIEIALTPQDLERTHGLEISFATPGAISPIQAGISQEDSRVLGIGITSAIFK
jgi:hypothetical protein